MSPSHECRGGVRLGLVVDEGIEGRSFQLQFFLYIYSHLFIKITHFVFIYLLFLFCHFFAHNVIYVRVDFSCNGAVARIFLSGCWRGRGVGAREATEDQTIETHLLIA